MEYGNFEPIRFEQSDETSDESKSKSKKKKRAAASSSATSPEASKDTKKEEIAKQAESLLRRLIGENPKTELDIEAKDAPSEHADSIDMETLPTAVTGETLNDVERLDADEERYALEAYLDSREAALRDDNGEEEPADDTQIRRANVAFLAAIRQNLTRDETGVNPVDEAFEQVVQDIHSNTLEASTDESAERQAVPHVVDRPSWQRQENRNDSPVEAASVRAQDFPMSSAEQMPETVYIRHNNAGNLLVGGVIGYVLGRRRGRIKTEKRLAVVQKKLEKQIDAVQQQVIRRETQIQQLVREKVAASRTSINQAESLQLAVGRQSEKRLPKTETRTAPFKRPVEAPPSATRPEMSRMRTASTLERGPQRSELSRGDILALSERVTIGATNLRQIYETKLIGESGLRRLVSEHLEGRDIRRALAREFLAKELSFERDPRLRDSLLGNESAGDSQAGISPSNVSRSTVPQDAPPEQRASGSTNAKHADNLSSESKNSVSTGLLTALTLLALGLAVYAILLSMNR